MTAPLQLRPWTTQDHELIQQWRKIRGVPEFPIAIVPPVAAVVERAGEAIASACLFVTVPRDGGQCIGLCEYFTTAPGLSLADTRECAAAIMDLFRETGRLEGVVILLAFADKIPARVLKGLGMSDAGPALFPLTETL